MYHLKEWHENLDLSVFYKECAARGYENNSSQKKMIDCFQNEKEWNAWILYNNKKPIGSVAAHSFDLMGHNSYRILARTCVLEGVRSKGLMVAKTAIREHQNFTDQFFVPTCINWAGEDARVFATSNESKEASQRLVHRYYFPTLERLGLVKKIKKVFYRGLEQQVWEIYPKKFIDHLDCFPRWNTL